MDGTGDNADAFPMDAMETMDSDMDGVGDNADAFPMDAAETMDSDMDGVGDNADPFPMDAMETMDSDMDGVGDNADAFPMDATETMDSDMDGTGDNADVFPMDAAETMDSDMDGVGDNADAFPMDAMETVDSDMDGTGDNADAFPMDATETMDSDGDSVGDNADAFPMDRTEWADADNDGRGDNAYPPDRDGDGVADVADRFPDDPAESQDSDEDGVGNNADAFPFNAAETRDSDGDGTGDNADAFPNDATETADSDGDGVGDNADAFPGDPDDRLRLFQAANGYHVMDDPATPVDERAAHVTSVGEAMATIAAAQDGNQGAGTTATAAWPADGLATNGDANNDEDGNPLPGMLSLSVNPGAGGTPIPFELGATRAADTTATPPVTARTQTAMEIGDLGAFQGYSIWEDDGDADTTTDRARVIAYTDREQDTYTTPARPAVTAKTITNSAASSGTVTVLGSQSGDTYTDVTFFEAGADTEDAGFGFTGTLTCAAGAMCSATTNADGTITVSGYTFTGTRAVRPAMAAIGNTENNDYLVFGLWLDEADNGDDTFGAFATGPAAYAAAAEMEITGEATYNGKATGAHHKTGESVSWFDGDARLTAKFEEDDEAGTISGAISNIRVGGVLRSGSIDLRPADLTDGNAAFNGVARMGARMVDDDDVVSYPFVGTWSGSFFGASEAVMDDATTPANEMVEAGHQAPGAVAGTFGVTGEDDMGTTTETDDVTESFVGAFGAHKDD